MTKIRRIDFSPDEWIAGTIGMSLEEEGLYMRICTLIYSRGGPIEVVQLHRVGLHGNKLNALLERLLSMGKIERNGGEIDQKRCRIELETARIRLRKASENGILGNKIKRLKHATRDGVASANHQPSTIKEDSSSSLQSEEESRPSACAGKACAASPDFLLEKGLKLLGHRRGALVRRMRLRHGEERVTKALAAVERKHPVEPVAFFLACCEDRRSEPEPAILGRPPPDYGPKTPPPRPEDLWPRED
jgi:uncharacterized protein YdaU (DUF1376 family)